MSGHPPPAQRDVVPRILLLVSLLAALFLSAPPAVAEGPAPGYRGQAAVDQLGPDLPSVAAAYDMTPERLQDLLLTDSTLAVDKGGRLVYLDDFLPEGPAPASSAGIALQGPYADGQTFTLHSLPGGTKVIYLDFDGHTTTSSYWNGGATIVSAPFDLDGNPASWSTEELALIQCIWQRVAEDYLPYGVDVTTQDPGVEALRNTGGADQDWGVRVVISPSSAWFGNYGGVAYVGSFNWNTDTPCFVFSDKLGPNNEKYVAEAISHEAGHTVGLSHDGVTGGDAYYSGHGGWAPIMGVGYYQPLVQWSKGEYAGANNTEDDLAIMTRYGFTYRPDDHGNTTATATPLTVAGGTAVSGKGIIEQTADRDYFSFLTGGGTVTFDVTPATRDPDLDILVQLYNSQGTLVAAGNPAALDASISAVLPAGTYYLVVDGAGTGDPTTGYSDYGSLGEFNIRGTIVAAGTLQAPIAAASATPTSGNAPLEVAFSSAGSYDPDGSTLSYFWSFGDGIGSSEANPTHIYTGKSTYNAALTVTDRDGLTGTARVVITVVVGPPAEPSSLTATSVSSSQINLTWADNSTDETWFDIERSPDGANWSQIATAGANVRSYSDTGVAAVTTYWYRVRAHNASGYSLYSNTANATTPPVAAAMHVGDLDGVPTTAKKNWTANVTITVHDATHNPVTGALVSGTWSKGGATSCTTLANGACTVKSSALSVGSVTFSVSSISKSGWTYMAAANHDVDSGTNGTTITVTKTQ